MKIIDFIPKGRDNARKHVESICSVCCGAKCEYYIPRDLNEVQIYLRQQCSRHKSLRAALNGVVKFFRKIERSGKK